MAAGWKDLLPWRNDPAARSGAAPEELVQFADQIGYSIIKTPDGKYLPVPRDINPKEVPGLIGNWDKLYDEQWHSFENREKRIKIYKMMDQSGAEGAVILDTYADEVVNVVDNSQESIQIQFSDEEIGKKIMAVLNGNKVLQNMRQDVRAMLKYGDFCYLIAPRRGQALIKITEAEAKAGTKIDSPLNPEDIHLSFARSDEYSLAGFGDRVYKMRMERDVLGGFKLEDDEYMPWEFVPFTIADRECFPYGLSILERSRVPFEMLTILEKLLAVSRANSVDRIAVKVPGTGGDPTTQLARLSQIKNSLKTILQIGANSRMTRNQDVGMTEWLFVPKDFEVAKLSTSIPLGSPEDVTYFRDKLHNSSRLPKGFFITTESTNATRPMSLRQQDIKFARGLIPIGEAYCNGLQQLCILLAFYLGADISTFQCSASMKKSPYISDDLLNVYSNVLKLLDDYVAIRRNIEPDYKVTKGDIIGILDTVDAPAHLFFPSEEESRFNGNSCNSLYEAVSIAQGNGVYASSEYKRG
jgi:hypothetical protein